jgi:Protein of unknown function (DUF3631)
MKRSDFEKKILPVAKRVHGFTHEETLTHQYHPRVIKTLHADRNGTTYRVESDGSITAGLPAGESMPLWARLTGKPYAVAAEGEKDTLTLARLGFDALDFQTYRPERDEPLLSACAAIVCLRDNDESGERQRERFIAKLPRRLLAVRMDLPGIESVGEKADVTDWLDAGHSLQEFYAVMNAAIVEHRAARRMQASSLLRDIEELLSRFLVVTEAQRCVLATWALATYVADRQDFAPYVSITAPEVQSGKSRVLEMLALLCRDPLGPMVSVSEPIFRSLDERMRTLLLDEAHTIFNGNQERAEALLGILSGGFEADAGGVLRYVPAGKTYVERQFRTYGPKAIAGIGDLPETLTTRAVPIRMRKASPEEMQSVERYSLANKRRAKADAARLRQRMQDWASGVELGEPEVPNFGTDRRDDISEPLCAVADAIGEGLRVRQALAEVYTGSVGHLNGISNDLLRDVVEVFESFPEEVRGLRSSTICERLAEIEAAPWKSIIRDTLPINPAMLSRMLEPYGLRPRVMRAESDWHKRERGYTREEIMKAAAVWVEKVEEPLPF